MLVAGVAAAQSPWLIRSARVGEPTCAVPVRFNHVAAACARTLSGRAALARSAFARGHRRLGLADAGGSRVLVRAGAGRSRRPIHLGCFSLGCAGAAAAGSVGQPPLSVHDLALCPGGDGVVADGCGPETDAASLTAGRGAEPQRARKHWQQEPAINASQRVVPRSTDPGRYDATRQRAVPAERDSETSGLRSAGRSSNGRVLSFASPSACAERLA